MKFAVVLALSALLATFAVASSEEFEKKGFFTTKWCAEQGMFKDCRLETVVCGSGGCFQDWKFGDPTKEELVLYVHDDGKYYPVSLDGIPRSELDEAINRNEVTFVGEFDASKNMIVAKEFKAPPPPKKSFFKGCL